MSAVAWSDEIIQANTWLPMGQNAPVGGLAVNICVVNRNGNDAAMVDVAISDDPAGPGPEDFIEEYTKVVRGFPLMRTGEPLKEREKVYVRSSLTGVSIRVSGYDKL